MKKIFPLGLIVFILIFINTGCVSQTKKGKVWQPVKTKKAPLVHLVQWPEEILPIIAEWYTGDIKNSGSIADANPNINPDYLSVGNKIFISEELVKTRNPLTKEFVTEYYTKLKKKKKSSRPVKKPAKTAPETDKTEPLPREPDKPDEPDEPDEFEIIGPK